MNKDELMALFERAAILVLQGKCQSVSSALVGAIKIIYEGERNYGLWSQALRMTKSIYGSATTEGFHYMGGYSGKAWLSAEDKQTLVLMLCFMHSIVESGYIA